MKKLTKNKRDRVRLLIRRASDDIKAAKAITFKAYGSRYTTACLKSALDELGGAVLSLRSTKLPAKAYKLSDTDMPSNRPAKGRECSVAKESTKKPEEERGEVDELFKQVVCDQLGVRSEQCLPQARFVEDLGADEFDPLELAMALEEEFQITFSDEEADGLTTYGELLNLVKEKVETKKRESSANVQA